MFKYDDTVPKTNCEFAPENRPLKPQTEMTIVSLCNHFSCFFWLLVLGTLRGWQENNFDGKILPGNLLEPVAVIPPTWFHHGNLRGPPQGHPQEIAGPIFRPY